MRIPARERHSNAGGGVVRAGLVVRRSAWGGILAVVLLGLGAPIGSGLPGGTTRSPDAHRASCENPSFEQGNAFPVPSNPIGVVIADFSTDGTPDLAVGGLAFSGVQILLGDGNGDFRSGERLLDGLNVTSLAAGDFNEDGRIDLVLSAEDSSWILFGDGAGDFVPGAFSLDPGQPFLAVADFDDDGHADVGAVSGLGGFNTVRVLLGDGAGAFAAPLQTGFEGLPLGGMSTGDVDGDGTPDIVVTVSAGATILLNDGTGSLSVSGTFPAGRGPAGVGIADFDGDDVPDLAIADSASAQVLVLGGRGSGDFRPARAFSAGERPELLLAGDFTGDGQADVVVVNALSADLALLSGNGLGDLALVSPRFAVNGPINAAASGDLDKDGRLDAVLVANIGGAVFLSVGEGFQAAPIFSSGGDPAGLAVADFDEDGSPDVAAPLFRSGEVAILLASEPGSFQAPARFPAIARADGIAAGDFDGDGHVDVATGEYQGSRIVVARGDGTGRLLAPKSYTVDDWPADIAAADFDRDGRLDLAVANYGSGSVSILRRGTIDFEPAMSVPVGNAPQCLAVADFDGDGFLDLAVGRAGTSEVALLWGDGQGGFGPAAFFDASGWQFDLTVGDFDENGHPDLGVATGDSRIAVLLWEGTAGFGAARVLPAGETPASIAAGDVDGDGHVDLVTTEASFSHVFFFRGDGSGRFQGASTQSGSGGGALALALSDANGDGRLDVLVAASLARGVTVLLGNALAILPTGLSSGTVGVPYVDESFEAIGGRQPVALAAVGLPPGLTFDPGHGVLSGIPTEAGSFQPRISATDSAGCRVSRSYTLAVARAQTRLTLAFSANPSPPGTAVTVRVSLGSPGLPSPTGTVTFFVDGVAQPPVPLIDGVATLLLPPLPPGAHHVTATYSGDANFDAGASGVFVLFVGVAAIPALGNLGAIVMAVLLAGVGFLTIRR